MIHVNFDVNELRGIIREEVERAVREAVQVNDLPPLLSSVQLMEVLGIGRTKASELMNREGFPVIRDFGHPKVPTDLLFEWIRQNAGFESDIDVSRFM